MTKGVEEKYKEMFKDNDLFTMKEIMNVNHKPHPYMITPKHIALPGGMLDPDVIKAGEKAGKCKCGQKGCDVPYEQHTADKVMFLELKRNGTEAEANAILKEIAPHLTDDLIDGFAMVETKDKFRIQDEQ